MLHLANLSRKPQLIKSHYGTALSCALSLPLMDTPLSMQGKLLSIIQMVKKCMQSSIGKWDVSEHNARMFSSPSQSVMLYQRNPIGSAGEHEHAACSLLMLCYKFSGYLSPNSSLRVTSGCHLKTKICILS